MKQTILVLLLLSLALTLCACGAAPAAGEASEAPAAAVESSPFTPEEPSPAEEPVPAEEPSPAVPAEPAVVSADYASEELLAQPDSYDDFQDDSSEYATPVAFTVNAAVTDFRYFAIEADFSGEDVTLTQGDELCALDTLTPERPLVISMSFSDTVPLRGISYVDGDGVQHRFSLFMSGMDGSLLLEAF